MFALINWIEANNKPTSPFSDWRTNIPDACRVLINLPANSLQLNRPRPIAVIHRGTGGAMSLGKLSMTTSWGGNSSGIARHGTRSLAPRHARAILFPKRLRNANVSGPPHRQRGFTPEIAGLRLPVSMSGLAGCTFRKAVRRSHAVSEPASSRHPSPVLIRECGD